MNELELLKKAANDLADASVKASVIVGGKLDESKFNQASKYVEQFLDFLDTSSSLLRKSIDAAKTLQELKQKEQ